MFDEETVGTTLAIIGVGAAIAGAWVAFGFGAFLIATGALIALVGIAIRDI